MPGGGLNRTRRTSTARPRGGSIPALSVVVPTRNEADNVVALVERLAEALRGIPSEVVFVDDSTDDTPLVISRVARRRRAGLEVVPILRPAEQRTGLGSAVAEGMKRARGGAIAVMDGDLQHPPELLRALVAAADEHELDVVVASRYIAGGSARGLAGPARRAVSALSKLLTQILFREARKTSDPLSGYFLCRRSAVEGLEFRPIGFKILLEVLVCAPDAEVGDVPLVFDHRHSGVSNASMAQGLAFVRHLVSLIVQVPGSARFWKYAVVGAAGLAVFIGILFLGQVSGFTPFQSWAAAFTLSLAANWQLNRVFTFADVASPFTPGRSRPVYLPVALAGGCLNLVMFTALLPRMPSTLAGLCGAATAMVFNYLFHRTLLRRSPQLWLTGPGAATALVDQVRGLLDGELRMLPPDADERTLAAAFPTSAGAPEELLRAAAQRKPIMIATAPSPVPQARHDVGLTAWLGVPVMEGRRYLGLLVGHRQGRSYTEEELDRVLRAVQSEAREIEPLLASR